LITKVELENCQTPFCVVHVQELTPGVQRVVDTITAMDENGRTLSFKGWDGDFCTMIAPDDVYRIFTQDKKVFIETAADTFQLKIRLYEAEKMLEQNGLNKFIRISNTDMVNFQNADHLDFSLSGVIKVILKNDTALVVSRRYMGTIKEKLCLKK